MWPFTRRPKSQRAQAVAPPELGEQQPDLPQGFGYKNAWWALNTEDTARVIDVVGLQNPQRANWATGIRHAYENCVFVCPPIDQWTLLVGFRLPPSSERAREEVVMSLLKLSDTFGTAAAFATHRVVGFNVWCKAQHGDLVRGFGYSGERGETFWDDGESTQEERDLGFRFFDERSPDAKNESYWEREDLKYPDEDHVMQIAGAWSVNPTTLRERTDLVPALGWLGTGTLSPETRPPMQS